MYLTIIKGLPVRIIRAITKQGDPVEFKVSTEAVQSIILPFIERKFGIMGVSRPYYEEFDDEVKYYLPDDIFLFKDEEILKYINMNIDDHYAII